MYSCTSVSNLNSVTSRASCSLSVFLQVSLGDVEPSRSLWLRSLNYHWLSQRFCWFSSYNCWTRSFWNIVSCRLRIPRDPSHWLENLQVVLAVSRLFSDRLHGENTGSIFNNLPFSTPDPLTTSVSGVRCLTILYFSRSVKQVVQNSCMLNQPCQDHTVISTFQSPSNNGSSRAPVISMIDATSSSQAIAR